MNFKKTKRIFRFIAFFLSAASVVTASGSVCEHGIPDCCGKAVKAKSTIEVYGWLMAGITVNEYGSTNKYGNPGPYAYNRSITPQSGNSSILMLEQPSDLKLNQLWVGAKKELGNKFDWGFRADLSYGTDLRYPRFWGDQSFDYNWGSGDYYGALVNCYATVGTKKLNVRVGKFGGGFSYESLAAPTEFFYSHADIAYARPMTVSGVMLEYKPNDSWAFNAAWTAGCFNSFDNSFPDNGFLGKITYNFTKNLSLTYKTFFNDKGGNFRSYDSAQDFLNTLILTWRINERWYYMIESAVTDGKIYDSFGKTGSDSWGINQHLIYTPTGSKWSAGLRGEFHHAHGTVFDSPTVTGGQGGNLIEITAALHYNFTPKIFIRPELRYDYAAYDNGYRPFGNESYKGQLSGGVSFVAGF